MRHVQLIVILHISSPCLTTNGPLVLLPTIPSHTTHTERHYIVIELTPPMYLDVYTVLTYLDICVFIHDTLTTLELFEIPNIVTITESKL